MGKGSKSLITVLLFRTLDQYRRILVQLAKIRGAEIYLKTVQAARMSAIGLVSLLIGVGLLLTGFIFLHGALLFYVDWTNNEKAIFLLISGLIYFSIPLAILLRGLSNRQWMEMTHADDVVDKATRR